MWAGFPDDVENTRNTTGSDKEESGELLMHYIA
jgi:hypothetical protein